MFEKYLQRSLKPTSFKYLHTFKKERIYLSSQQKQG